MRGPDGATYEQGQVDLMDETGNALLHAYVPVNSTGAGGSQLINQAFDLRVGASQYLSIGIQLANFTASTAYCTATGTMETLG